MTLELDTSTSLRGTDDLRRLVKAVVAAGEHDEADWVEWKGPLDLSTKEGCFQLARSILGMANRSPERAALTCEGVGYVVVGAGPGDLSGVSSVDKADLDQILEPYLGRTEGSPRWAPIYVSVDGSTVLVVIIEPPRAGDRIALLRREFTKNPSGSVFVRKHARTVPANADDLDALERRLLAAPVSSAQLEVSLVGDVPLSWFNGAAEADVISAWATERRGGLVARARAVDRARNPQRYSSEPNLTDPSGLGAAAAGFAQRQADLNAAILGSVDSMFTAQEDRRTLDEYIAEVEQWTKRLLHAAGGVWRGRYTAAGHGRVRLRVKNLSDRFLSDVQVRARLECDRRYGLQRRPERSRLPAPPWPFGKRKPPPDPGGGLTRIYPDLSAMPRVDPSPPRTWLEDGSIQIVFDVGDLRPQGNDESDEVCILLPRRLESDVLLGAWDATARDVHAVLKGTMKVPTAPEPVDLRALLDAAGD